MITGPPKTGTSHKMLYLSGTIFCQHINNLNYFCDIFFLINTYFYQQDASVADKVTIAIRNSCGQFHKN